MEDQQRNLLLAVTLSIAVLLGWQIFIDGPQQRERQRLAQEAAQEQALLEGEQGAGSTGSQANGGLANGGLGSVTTNAGASSNASSNALNAAQAADQGQRIPFQTTAFTGAINTHGARIDEITLNKYRETLDEDSENIKLLQPMGSANPYFTDYGWNVTDRSRQQTTPDTVWQVASQSGNQTVLTTSLDGLDYQLTYTITEDDYIVKVDQTVTNSSGNPVNLRPFGRVIRFGEPQTSGFWILHEGPIGFFSEDHLEEITYKKVRNDDDKLIQFNSTGGWMGFTDKYWLAALLPGQNDNLDVFYRHNPRGNGFYENFFQAGEETLGAGQSRTYSSHVFFGAKEVNLLDKYSEKYNLSNFDKAVDFGWFYFLTKPFFKALSFLFGIFGNFGVAILVMTLIIKLLLFPLANASYRSMSKMKLLAPKIAELKEQYGDDRAKLQQATMKFYKEEGVNPLGGCLPILVQIPIFFALYKVLLTAIEMRHAPFFGWIHDLSAKDPTSILNLFGLLPFDPNTGLLAALSFISIGIWPIIMGVTMYMQQRLNPPPTDPIQAKVMQFLPLIFTFILAPFAAGLVIYWSWNNILTFAQQWWIMRNTKLETVKVKPAKPSKPGFLDRLIERRDAQNKDK